ncbi:Uncharacterised protein [Salmonella enterica subsp. enterica]|uniref:Uncharacterized protein n=1 Tax=Salmonella enterica I TaxID=59201 RepID=A0A379WGM4_SALET|nr:Uncharacterised protein [Salmonella enterica subsp. enterica]
MKTRGVEIRQLSLIPISLEICGAESWRAC